MKLAIGLALLILAALLAAVGWVLARPRWRWEPPTVDEVEPSYWRDLIDTAREPHLVGGVWWQGGKPHFSTGSPESVTSRADNGTNWRP